MRLRNMLKICLVFWESEPQYAYKRYAYKKTCILIGMIYIDFASSYQDVSRGKSTVLQQLYIPKLYCACARDHEYGRMIHHIDVRQVCQ